MVYYLEQIVDGIATGSIYGVFAMAVVLLFRANKLFNLAQTEIATLSVVLMMFLLKKFSLPIAFVLTLGISFVFGALLHLLIIRFITERRQVLHSSEVISTIALMTIFSSISAYLLGDEPQPFPSLFGQHHWKLAGVNVSSIGVGIVGTTFSVALAVYLFFRFTRVGLVFEAVAESIPLARLRGIRASNMLALAWGLSSMIGAIGGALIAPVLFVTPTMLNNVYSFSLIAVVIGGLESPFGALLGGILIGVIENLGSNIGFIGVELKFLVVLVLLLTVLVVRPRGIWGRAEARRV